MNEFEEKILWSVKICFMALMIVCMTYATKSLIRIQKAVEGIHFELTEQRVSKRN